MSLSVIVNRNGTLEQLPVRVDGDSVRIGWHGQDTSQNMTPTAEDLARALDPARAGGVVLAFDNVVGSGSRSCRRVLVRNKKQRGRLRFSHVELRLGAIEPHDFQALKDAKWIFHHAVHRVMSFAKAFPESKPSQYDLKRIKYE